MVLSNRARQERHRAKARADALLLERLVAGWLEDRDDLYRQLDLLEAGLLRTGANNVDDTSTSVARVRRWLADYDALIAEYGRTEVPANHWLIQPVPGAQGIFAATEQPQSTNSGTLAGTRPQVEAALAGMGCIASRADPDAWYLPRPLSDELVWLLRCLRDGLPYDQRRYLAVIEQASLHGLV